VCRPRLQCSGAAGAPIPGCSVTPAAWLVLGCLRASAHAKEQHGSLALAATAPQVQRVLDLLGMGAVITGYPSAAAALESTRT
jgi:hypothetical protein